MFKFSLILNQSLFFRRFIAYNPTPYAYNFSWIEENKNKSEFPLFLCSTPDGEIEGRKGITVRNEIYLPP